MLRPTPPQSTAPLSPKSPLVIGREAHASDTSSLAEQAVHSVESNRAFNQVRAAVNSVTDLLALRLLGPPSVSLRHLPKPHPLHTASTPHRTHSHTSHTSLAPTPPSTPLSPQYRYGEGGQGKDGSLVHAGDAALMDARGHDVSRLVAMGVLDPSAVPVSERAAAEAALSAAAASVVVPESLPTTEAEEADPKAARRARFEQFLSQYAVFLPHLFPRGDKDTRRVLAVIDGGDEAAFERTLVALHQQASMVATRMPSLASGNNMQACISPREGDRIGAPARAAHQDPNYSVKYHSEGVTTCFTPPVAVTERAVLPESLTAVRVCTEGYMNRDPTVPHCQRSVHYSVGVYQRGSRGVGLHDGFCTHTHTQYVRVGYRWYSVLATVCARSCKVFLLRLLIQAVHVAHIWRVLAIL